MARTISQIFDEIQAARLREPALAALTSPSATSLHRLWAYITAVVLWAHEQLWERHRADVDKALARAKPGTAAWYADQALLFQEGDQLIADDEGIHYAAGSTGEKIITRASAKENDTTGRLFIKVATDGKEKGTLAGLSAQQLVQVRGYFHEKRFAGTRLEVVSRAADRLKVAAEVHYDPLRDLPTLQAQAAAAISAYLGSLDFAGLIFLAKIQDALQAVPGVQDVKLLEVAARAGNGVPVVISRVYETQAGYIVEDDAAGRSFLETLQFIPYASA